MSESKRHMPCLNFRTLQSVMVNYGPNDETWKNSSDCWTLWADMYMNTDHICQNGLLIEQNKSKQMGSKLYWAVSRKAAANNKSLRTSINAFPWSYSAIL